LIDEEKVEPDYPAENKACKNLFETEQLILCSLNFLTQNDHARAQAQATDWDLLVVDEAHHLQWSEDKVSPEYRCIEQLAVRSKGLLLLTATPEQVGAESHFARLRLLDPSRFYDFSVFMKEEENYQKINELAQKLLSYQEEMGTDELDTALKQRAQEYLGEYQTHSITETINSLLDRHGTGRVLFRNTRAAIKGFPIRHVNAHALPYPEIYALIMMQHDVLNLNPEHHLGGELWLEHDPRASWLVDTINELHPRKILIICAKAKTAVSLDCYLKLKKGIRSAAFHEGLTIIERDRAAAYFSDVEDGAQVLVCSEIGSEGRNFQFSHHLVLFDLPLNPDLLEQRIGRLDRIGQKNTVEIHVPYLMGTAQEKLFRWYHEGINLFEKSCSVGFNIYKAFAHQLLPILQQEQLDDSQLNTLINDTKLYTAELNHKLETGRDRLLELNSCNLPLALDLIAAIEAEENSLELENYMAKVFHEYGIDHEYHSEFAEILRPSDHMKTTHFPGLREDGVTVTYSRPKALIREDMEFLSWEHPMVHESMEMILNSETGNATLSTISVKSIAPGTLFLETFFTVNYAAPKLLQIDRFLPCTPIRILMTVSGKNLTNVLNYNQLNEMCEPVKRHLGYPIVKQIQPDLEKILGMSNETAEEQLQSIIEQAMQIMKNTIGQEINRLESLKKLNPAIRVDEIEFFNKQMADSGHCIASATLNLQAIRVVINK